MIRSPAHRTISLGSLEQLAPPPRGSDNGSHRAVYRHILQSGLQTQLTAKQREVVGRYYLQGETIYHIAAALQLHPSTVSRRLSGARKRLRSYAAGYLLARNDRSGTASDNMLY